MKNLFCLLACFCGFSLLVAEPIHPQVYKKVKVSTVNTTIERSGYKNCFCSISSAEKSLVCRICQHTGYLTPNFDRSDNPTSDLGGKPFSNLKLILPDNDRNESLCLTPKLRDCPTPKLSDCPTPNLSE